MSMKEDYQKFLQEQKLDAAAQARKEQSEIAYKKMYAHIWGAEYDENKLWHHDKLFFDFSKSDTYQGLYQKTLAVELPPDYQSIVDEFVEICPEWAWQCVPMSLDVSKVFCDWNNSSLVAEYLDQAYLTKIRLPDGSVHVEECDLSVSCYSNKNFRQGEKNVLQEAQYRLDCCQQVQQGVQEYVCFKYSLAYGEYAAYFIIFRDKTVFDLGKLCRESPLNGTQETFYQFLLKNLENLERQRPNLELQKKNEELSFKEKKRKRQSRTNKIIKGIFLRLFLVVYLIYLIVTIWVNKDIGGLILVLFVGILLFILGR